MFDKVLEFLRLPLFDLGGFTVYFHEYVPTIGFDKFFSVDSEIAVQEAITPCALAVDISCVIVQPSMSKMASVHFFPILSNTTRKTNTPFFSADVLAEDLPAFFM